MRMPGPDALTASMMLSALLSKSSTSAAGSIAMKVCPHDFAVFFSTCDPRGVTQSVGGKNRSCCAVIFNQDQKAAVHYSP